MTSAFTASLAAALRRHQCGRPGSGLNACPCNGRTDGPAWGGAVLSIDFIATSRLPSFVPLLSTVLAPPAPALLAPWTTPPLQGRPSSSAPSRRGASPTPSSARPRRRMGSPRTACCGRGRPSTRWGTTCWSTVGTWSTRGLPRSSCFTGTRVATCAFLGGVGGGGGEGDCGGGRMAREGIGAGGGGMCWRDRERPWLCR